MAFRLHLAHHRQLEVGHTQSFAEDEKCSLDRGGLAGAGGGEHVGDFFFGDIYE
jgi:hypothetical protein